MENLSPPTRGRTGTPCIGRRALNHWTAREVPGKLFKTSIAWVPATDCACVHAQSCPTLWRPNSLAHHAPLSVGLSWQEYWSGSPFPPPGDLPHPGMKPGSPASQADSLLLRHRGSPCHRSVEPNLGVGSAPRISEARRRLRTTDQGRNHKLSPSAASDQSKDDCVRWNLAAKDLTPSSFPVQPKLHLTFSKAGPAPFPLCRGVC